MMLSRKPDWTARLYAAVETAQLIRFQYGLHDCCLWAAHCVDEMCGTHFAASVKERFNYGDKESADKVIEAGGGLHRIVTEFLGEPTSATMAAPGDVVIARNMDDEAIVGVVVGHRIIAPGPNGLVSLPYERGVMCWKV